MRSVNGTNTTRSGGRVAAALVPGITVATTLIAGVCFAAPATPAHATHTAHQAAHLTTTTAQTVTAHPATAAHRSVVHVTTHTTTSTHVAAAATTPATVVHTVTTTATPAPSGPTSNVATPAAQQVLTTSARSRLIAADVASMRDFNYEPSDGGWTLLWTNFRPAILSRDFARISAMGANTVRISVFPNTFGYPNPSPVMMDRLQTVLRLAASNGLRVQITLFDWFGAWNDIAGSTQFLTNVLTPLAHDPRIAMIEITNEVNPGNAAQVVWLRAMLPVLRTVAPNIPSTVSVCGPGAPGGIAGWTKLAGELAGVPLDVADIHYYGTTQDAYSWFTQAKAAAAPLPLFVGEAGYSVVNGTGTPGDPQETAQAQWYQTIFAAAAAAGVADPAPWTLNDFTSAAIPVVGTTVPAIEYSYGLYRVDGTARPAVAVLTAIYHHTAVDTLDGTFSSATADGMPTGWSAYMPSNETAGYDASVGYADPGSLRIAATAAGSGGYPGAVAEPANPVIAGQTWTASVWAKGTGLAGTDQIAIAWFGPNYQYLSSSNSQALGHGAVGWTQLTATSHVPAGAVAAEIFLKAGDEPGTVWFDDVTVSVS